jgi:hypothetical protein
LTMVSTRPCQDGGSNCGNGGIAGHPRPGSVPRR